MFNGCREVGSNEEQSKPQLSEQRENKEQQLFKKTHGLFFALQQLRFPRVTELTSQLTEKC